MKPTLYSIAPGQPFLEMLAEGLIDRHSSDTDPFALARAELYLPNRRAARALESAFLEVLAKRGRGKALLLPRIRTIGDGDEEASFLEAARTYPSADISALPRAIGRLDRRLLLAALIGRKAAAEGRGPQLSESLVWAKSLERFLDEAIIEGIDLTRATTLVAGPFAQHWLRSAAFLEILSRHWPEILAEIGAIDAIDRRGRLIRAAAEGLRHAAGPFYVAGSTGSVPATSDLMLAIAHHANGAVILPGLDRTLSEDAWAAIGETHPQAGLKRFLERAGLSRADVEDWVEVPMPPARKHRLRLISEAMKPATKTDSWVTIRPQMDFTQATLGLNLFEAEDEAEEARVIALLMRETLEEAEKRAALVTANRKLARRVAAELKRFGITVNDSAGRPLAHEPQWIFLAAILEAVLGDFAPIPLLALIKHPFADPPVTPASAGWRDALERHLLRGLRPPPGMAGLRARLSALAARDTDGAPALTGQLASVIDGLETAFGAWRTKPNDLRPPGVWVEEHLKVAAAIAGARAAELWQGEAGEAAMTALLELSTLSDGAGTVSLDEYCALFLDIGKEAVVRIRHSLHPRLFIWGPLEARLQTADLMIVGGLTEGSWPEEVDADPWASRPMRAELGLPPPERRIGLAAHDFVQLTAAPRVVLTYAVKVDGAPATPSRFLARLTTLIGKPAREAGVERGLPAPLDPAYRDLARRLSAPERYAPAARPEPRPPPLARPRRLSVTEIETLIRDPYAIYARHILKLKVLEPADRPPDMRDLGTLMHKAFEEFALSYPRDLPPAPAMVIASIAKGHIQSSDLPPHVIRLWSHELERAAQALADWESKARAGFAVEGVETPMELEIAAAGGVFILRGRADRIDRQGARARIIDYKSGRIPSDKQIKAGLAPQLLLEGIALQRGAFQGIAPADDVELVYVKPRDRRKTSFAIPDVAALTDKMAKVLVREIDRFDRAETPYRSKAVAFKISEMGDYDALARVAEWRTALDAEAGEE